MHYTPPPRDPKAPPVKINLLSDTQTRPTPAMREAMARAEVGDEQIGDDPTVNLLCERVAELLEDMAKDGELDLDDPLDAAHQFLGLAQLLVYVGAIAVLIVFVILLTRGGDSDAGPLVPTRLPITGILVATTILALLAWAVFHSSVIHSPESPVPAATVRELGTVLMADYVLPLEVIGLMLTAALIGAVVVAMKEKQDPQ